MKIPEKIKIGGSTYKVEITKNLDLGSNFYLGETVYSDRIIRVVPAAKESMESTFLHELVHAIYYHLGYRDHDEKKVDELAQALYMVIQDNQEMFEVSDSEEE